MPLVNWLCLVSYRDATKAFDEGTFNYLSTTAIFINEGARRMLSRYRAAVPAYLRGAIAFTALCFARFDRVAGRLKGGTASACQRTAVEAARLSSSAALPAPRTL